MPMRAPAVRQLAGLGVALAAVVIYSGYTQIQIEGLRRLQTDTLDRNRRGSLQLVRIQNSLNLIGLTFRDMERDGDPYPLTAYRPQLDRLRSGLEDALAKEAALAPATRVAAQQKLLEDTCARFWKETSTLWPLAADGRLNDARALIRTRLEAERATMASLVSALLVQNQDAESAAQAQIAAIYSRVERNLYLLLAAVLLAIAATSLYVIRVNRRVLQRIEALSEQRRTLAGQVISVQEELFRALARELHDEFGQVLTAMGVMLQRASKRIPAESTAHEDIREVREIAHQTLEKVRAMSQMLHPPVLDDYGLERSIEWYTDKYAKQTGLTIHYEKIGIGPWIGDQIAIHMYRILQEALNNVVRHADTREAWVRVRYEPHRMEMVVEDHGKGMPAQPEASGIGMIAMRERTGLLNGDIDFSTPPAGGTRIAVRIPLTAVGDPS
ncbi:MAG: sensor histidine kinase [Bryobacteraceae bacterium]|nr:sensor histidine kinase [Solibacteraceae bacterium]MCO5352769.1 sensor histidine kinase [Bryobacteraceae bacterium]